MKYPVLNSREWHGLSVKDKLISIILNAGHSLSEIDMEAIEEISSRWDKPLEPSK
jgi:S-adenosylhomocysteine hydrolase